MKTIKIATILICIVLCGGCEKVHNMTEPEKNVDPIVKMDFQTTFPHKYWISEWSKDASYPNGFRYKILSVRNEADSWVEFVIVMEEPGGLKTVRKRLDIKLKAFDNISSKLCAGLAEDFSLSFEEQDFSHIRDADAFEKAIREVGWHEWKEK